MQTFHRSHRLALLTSAVSLVATMLAAPRAFAESPRIVGGQPAEVCQWPTTVDVFNYCTGTLVHPRVVLYAAHCNFSPGGTTPNYPTSIDFGENGLSPKKSVAVQFCKVDPDYYHPNGINNHGDDIAFCVLKEAIADMPIAPIIQGCEGEILSSGNEATLVGFGYSDNGDTSKDDVKHWVNVPINGLAQGNTEISVGGNSGKGSCPGDSGGPAFVQLDDGTWRTAGITSYGAGHGSCGYEPSYYTRAELAIELIESELAKQGIDDIDLTPCFDGETWSPNAECGGYALELDTAHGSWADACSEGAPKGGYSATCGEPFDDGDEDDDSTSEDDDTTEDDDDSTSEDEDDSSTDEDDESTSEDDDDESTSEDDEDESSSNEDDDDSDESTPTTEDSDASDNDDEDESDDEQSEDPTPSDSDDDEDDKTKNNDTNDDESGCQCRGTSQSPLWAGLFVAFTPWLIRRRRSRRS